MKSNMPKPNMLKSILLISVGLSLVTATLNVPVMAQQTPPIQTPPDKDTSPEQSAQAQVAPIDADKTEAETKEVEQTSIPHPYVSGIISDSDAQNLRQALNAAKSRNFSQAESLRATLTDATARKIALWSILNNDGGDIYGFAALDAARRELWGWPKEQKRQFAAERLISTSGMTPSQIIEWFKGAPPISTEGAMALIMAYHSLDRDDEAQSLASSWWRNQPFDAAIQDRFYKSFSAYLTSRDHFDRLNMLLLGPQGPALTLLLSLNDEKSRQVADAAMALRSNRSGASDLFNAALAANPKNPVLAFEGAKYLHRHGLDTLAYPLLSYLPHAPESESITTSLWNERSFYFRSAIKNRDYVSAYHAMNKAGFIKGEKKAEAEFFAGWLALTKLHNPKAALAHFKAVKTAGTSPLTQGRANYWIGRAYEALDDGDEAFKAYKEGSQYIYAFYGQLAAEKAGVKTLTLGKDPIPSQADKARFENRDMVKAAKILNAVDSVDLLRSLFISIANNLPNAEEEALLYDMAVMYDSQDTASRMARISQQRGFYLPERAYQLRPIPDLKYPEPALIFAITRQESGFDPRVRSHANAKGMMQLIPATARYVARKLSISYDESKLYEPEYNMTLGANYLGQMVDQFGGSYIMAAAGYNAGPGRPAAWSQTYVEPRGEAGDPLGFIESAPFGETRDYMMRVIENMRVYRARLNGGSAPLTAYADIKRGVVTTFASVTDNSDGPVSYLDLQNGTTKTMGVSTQPITTQALPDATPLAPAPKPATPTIAPTPLDLGASSVSIPYIARPVKVSPKPTKKCVKTKRHKTQCKTVSSKASSKSSKAVVKKAKKSKTTKARAKKPKKH